MAGEQLMRLLETLDGISLAPDMFELRARRKKAAARINSLMDTNDSNIQVTTTQKWSLRCLTLFLLLQAIGEAAKHQKS